MIPYATLPVRFRWHFLLFQVRDSTQTDILFPFSVPTDALALAANGTSNLPRAAAFTKFIQLNVEYRVRDGAQTPHTVVEHLLA
jgi:hypothetical protein